MKLDTPLRALSLLALAVIVALAAPARASSSDFLFDKDQCVEDNPACTTPTICATKAACPGKPGDPQLGGTLQTYYSAANVGSCDYSRFPGNGCADPRATCTKPSVPATGVCATKLQGLLYQPSGHRSAKHPAVILVPGSSACTRATPSSPCTYFPEPFCEIKNVLLSKGFVVFEAMPRGYEFSTGQYVADDVTQQIVRDDQCAFDHPSTPIAACTVLDLEDEGTQDIGAAFRWLRGQSFVDPTKIAVLGHSYGGIRALSFDQFAYTDATHPNKPAAVVAIAPSSESWCAFQPMLPELLHDADIAKAPLYFLDTFNDVTRAPVVTLSAETGATAHQYQSAIFPPTRDAAGHVFTCGNDAHVCFANGKTEVDLWSPSVLDFLARYGVK